MSNTASLKKEYAERIAPALKNQFQYSSTMQIPVLKKIVINQGLGMAVADKKIIEVAINELTAITGQKAVATVSRKDIANFKLRKKMPIGVKDEGDCRVVYNVDAFCYIFRQRSFLDRGRNKFLVSIVCDRYKEVFGLQTSIFVAEYES